jgi:hypothetical protein
MTIAISGTNGITLDGQFNSASSMGFKNRIINGQMVLDQRNAGASVTPTNGQYLVDRFQAGLTQASKFTAQQSSTAPTGFSKSLLVTSSSAYSVLTTDNFYISQPIEGQNLIDLSWGTASAATVTLSFWVRSSLTGTFGGALLNSAVNRSYPYTYTISVADTWEQKSVTIAGDTSGTWLTTNGVGMRVFFSLGAGSTFSGTAGAWAGATYVSATGATSVVGTSGATFYITGVQLEKGSTATSFDYRPYGTELALCQRYFELFTQPSAACLLSGEFAGAGNNSLNVFYKQTKRAVPTVTAVVAWTNATPSTAPSIDVCAFQASAFFYMNGSAGATVLTFSAEL